MGAGVRPPGCSAQANATQSRAALIQSPLLFVGVIDTRTHGYKKYRWLYAELPGCQEATMNISLPEGWSLSFTLRDGLLLDIMMALMVHVVYKTYEPDATRFFIHLGLLVFVPLIPVSLLVPSILPPSLALFVVFSIFYVSLTASIILYRLSPFHPLAKYPGPVIARTSMLWTAYTISTGKVYAYRKMLHDKYGPFVRIGPNEISTTDVSLIPLVLGAEGMPKGPAWEGRVPFSPGLIATRDLHVHALLRKKWNRAFSTASVKEFEPIVWKRATQLVCKLQELSDADDGKMDLHRWLSYFTTDFMGDMAFNGGFEFMRDGEDKDGLWEMILQATRFQALIQSFAWVSRLVQGVIFGGRAKDHPLLRFAAEQAISRKKKGPVVKDLFYHLSDEADVEKVKPSMDDVILDSALAIVAGSDTTASVLTGIFVYLISHPDVYRRLQEEIDEAVPLSSIDASNGYPFETCKLTNLALLNAVINETLRLQPALPTFLQRAPSKGSGGKWLREHWLPEKTAITISPYVLHRDPGNFSPRPDDFWPDRWLQPPGTNSVLDTETGRDEYFVHNTNAFIPFSYGPANCAGKPLSMLEMRVVVTLLMQRFKMRFAESHGRERWEKELTDLNILETGGLEVYVSLR